MSQGGPLDIETTNPQIPTTFDTDSGSAVPLANVLEVLGGEGIDTSGSGNTVTISGEDATAAATAGAANKGIASFDSSMFTVTAGFVQLVGGGAGIGGVLTDSGAPAVEPDGSGEIQILGGEGIDVTGQGPGNIVTVAGEDASAVNKGIASFDPVDFTVSGGHVTLNATGAGQTVTADSGGALTPTGGNWNFLGGTNGIDTVGSGSTITFNFDVTEVAVIATSYATDSGTATPAANVLTIAGGTGCATTGAGSTVTVNVDAAVPLSFPTDSGTATPAANALTIAGGNGIDTSGSGSTVTVTFDISEVPTIPTSINTDSGTVTPSGNAISILGGPGITVTGSGSTVTVNSVVYTDQGGTTSVTSDSGSFATAAITLTLPAAPAQGDLVEFVCTTANALVVDAPSTHLIRLGTLISSAGGTVTSTAIGDSLSLRYRSSTTTWHAISIIGTWTLA